jgi:GT2 family glycosyltransferase
LDKIHIVIPVLNGWTQTRLCLEALRASHYRNLEIIVVDHGSTDATKRALPQDYPEVVHQLGASDLWWTGATNLGIRTARARGAQWIILLNNDCYVTPETIQNVLAHAQSLKDAIVAPIQRDYFSQQLLCTTAWTCYFLGFPTLVLPRASKRLIGERGLLPTKLIIGGRGVLIPTKVFDLVGLLDETNLPHAGSDNDFYLRCRKACIPLFIATDATVYVDSRTTTLAANIQDMTLRQFLQTLTDRRSHRNIRDLKALFRLHYPIKGLYLVGVALNLLRYFATYVWKRLQNHTIKDRQSSS